MCQGSKQILSIIKNLNCFKIIQSTILERALKSDLMYETSLNGAVVDRLQKPFILLYHHLLNEGWWLVAFGLSDCRLIC